MAFFDEQYLSRCSEKTLQTNEKGFFSHFSDTVFECAGKKWITHVFGKLQTDAERIRIIYEYKPVKDAVCKTLEHVQEIYRKKSAELSQKRRLEAEKLVSNCELDKALVLCSQSVLRASLTGSTPTVDDGFSLALALWTRSSVLIKLKKYKWALRDIQAANKESLPDYLKPEVFCRMAICYKGLCDSKKAHISLSLASKLATTTNNVQLIKQLEEIKNTEYLQEKEISRKLLPIVDTKNHADLLNASYKIAVKEEQGKGRYIAAKENINTGNTIVVEQPYASCLLPDCFGTHCHYCFERLVSPVGCSDCANVAFCTWECRDKAISTYHKYECHYLDLLIGSGMSILCHTALRMVTQSTLQNVLAAYKEKSNIYNLCTNAHLRTPEDFFQRTLMAAFLLRCLQKSGYFADSEANEDIIPNKEELCVGELLLYSLQMLQFNAHEIYETRHGPEHRIKAARHASIGVAIYSTAALFNHDCYPSVCRYFVGKHIVITASKPLYPGEMIGENYGPIFTKRSLIERQKTLSARYWFQCQCQACSQDWLSFDKGLKSYSLRLRCPNIKCSNLFTLPLHKEELFCPRCQKNVSLTNHLVQLNTVEKNYEVATKLTEDGDPQKAIAILCEAIDTFHRISSPPHYPTHVAQETLRACLANTGNTYCSLPVQTT